MARTTHPTAPTADSSPLVRLCGAVHVVSAALWAGVVLMASATAAVSFPTMKELGPTLATFAPFDGEHWPIAAGKVANRVFMIADAAQLVLAVAAVGTGGYLAFRERLGGRVLGIVRLVLFGLGLGLLGFQIFFLRPKMDVDLEAYWRAAAEGQAQAAETARAAFNARHPTASNLMAGTAAAAFGIAATGAWAGTRPTTRAAGAAS
ncbi:MAG: hypothetical protein AAF108_02655 [Planctomycetota bacterium]